MADRFVRFCLSVVLALGTVVILPQAVFADHHTATCSTFGDPSSFSAHGKNPVSNREATGVRATLERQQIKLCKQPWVWTQSASWVWVAVDGACGSSGNCIIQIGLGRCDNPITILPRCTNDTDTMGSWWAWGRHSSSTGCSGFSDVLPIPQRIENWPSSSVNYEVSLSGGNWNGYIGGVHKRAVGDAQICWRHDHLHYFGESFDRGDAIGGPDDNVFSLTNARYRRVGSSTWWGPAWSIGDCSIENPRPPYRCRVSGSDHLSMWTYRP